MKALILCAGLGTRLRPHTLHIPKPLFPVNGWPVLERILHSLIRAGCRSVMINTHHLHRQIEAYLAGRSYPVSVQTRHEPRILGTGGAIDNLRDFWDDEPFMVVNGDIVTDIDLKAVYDFHREQGPAATLVLVDYPPVNSVAVDAGRRIIGFDEGGGGAESDVPAPLKLTFTGIQVMDPRVLEWLPGSAFSSSIDLYRTLIGEGLTLKAYIPESSYWKDMGTPDRYRSAVLDALLPAAFDRAFSEKPDEPPILDPLAGDGSDRRWHRVRWGRQSLILADHGIHSLPGGPGECDAFVTIGRHLHGRGVSVPRIHAADSFAGLAVLEDLGDTHLQTLVIADRRPESRLAWYESAIRLLVDLSILGGNGFDPAWTYQTPFYDKPLILEKECRYFVDAFLNGYLNGGVQAADFADEFDALADRALDGAVTGFMHRDFQSRNLMVKDGRVAAIDFQGGRLGPLQYDLASLLIDPYVDLEPDLQERLLEICIRTLSARMPIDADAFSRAYRYCRITRNLQILGAFGFLTLVKKKPGFAAYIPAAVRTLNRSLSQLPAAGFPRLKDAAAQALQQVERGVS